MKVFKIIAITIVSILTALCIGVDAWWAYVYFKAPDKTVKTTYNIDLQTLVDGTQKPLIEVQLFRNADNSGVSAYEVMYNAITDENRTAFYSSGAQYIGNDFTSGWTGQAKFIANINNAPGFDGFYNANSSDGVEFLATSGKYGSLHKRKYYYVGLRQQFANLDTYYYESGSDFYNTFNSDSALKDGDILSATIKTGDAEDDYELIGMRFKGFNNFKYKSANNWDVERDDPSSQLGKYAKDFIYLGSDSAVQKRVIAEEELCYVHYYGGYDSNHFAVALYNKIKDLKAGTNSYDIIKIGDYFDFAKFNGSSYEWDDEVDTAKVEELIQSYCCIKVTIHDEGLTKASESLFGAVKGSADFNLTNDYTEDSYFVGRTNVVVNENMFIFINLVDNKYALKLKQTFLNENLPRKDVICLTINVDKDALLEKNIKIVGFSADSGLENFLVRSNNINTEEVAYV